MMSRGAGRGADVSSTTSDDARTPPIDSPTAEGGRTIDSGPATCPEARSTIAPERAEEGPLTVSDPDVSSVCDSPARETRVEPPRYLGDYEVIREIARGGMGVVYEARQLKAGRLVALKLIRDAALASLDELRRFRFEAEAIALLDHPNIVTVYEVGQDGGRPYFSMKLIDGGNLGHHVERLSADPYVAAGLLAKVARAVHEAHQRGILHRDLKPSNILIDARGEPYVTDFGLAKRLDAGDLPMATRTQAVMGTPGYMPPEQAQGRARDLTIAADVYGLGATLYEALTGRAPFVGYAVPEVLRQVVEDEPSRPRSLNATLDADLETICLKCLEKEPARRYASAAALADDLEAWRQGRPIAARPVRTWERAWKWARRRPALAGLVGVSAAALVGLVAGQAHYSASLARALDQAQRGQYAADMNLARLAWDARQVYRVRGLLETYRNAENGLDDLRGFEWFYLQKLCDPETVVLSGHKGKVTALIYHPGGHFLAAGGAESSLCLWDLDRKQKTRELPGHAGVITALDFSRDGTRLASASSDRTVRIWDFASGRCLHVLECSGVVRCVAFHPNGRLVLTTVDEHDEITLWDTEAEPPTGDSLRDVPSGNRGMASGFFSAQFSGDGREIYSSGNGRYAISVWDVASLKRVRALELKAGVVGLALTPDRSRLVAVDELGSMSVWNPAGQILEHTHENTRVINSTIRQEVALSPDGRLVAWTGIGRGGLNIIDADSGQRIETYDSAQLLAGQTIQFSPDGRFLATVRDAEILIRGIPTRQPQAVLATKQGMVRALAVSDDESLLAWAGPGRFVTLWEVGETRAPRRLERHRGTVLAVALAKDRGIPLLASADSGGEIRLWDARGEGPALRVLTGHSGSVTSLEFADGGRTLVSAGADRTVRFWDAASGRLMHSSAAQSTLVLSLAATPDRRRVVSGGGDGTVLVWDALTGRSVLGPLALGGQAAHVAVSPDGARIAAAGSAPGTEGKSKVGVWDAQSGRLVNEWPLQTLVHQMTFAPGPGRLIISGEDPALAVWDIVTGRETIALSGHTEPATSLVALSRSLRVYSAGRDGTVRVWQGIDPGPTKPSDRPRPRIVD